VSFATAFASKWLLLLVVVTLGYLLAVGVSP